MNSDILFLMLTGEGLPIQERSEDFGIDYQAVGAFSRSGLWDHDPSVHLNVHSAHQVIAVATGMILIENGREKEPLYQNMAAFIPAGKPHRAVLMRENMDFLCHSLFINPRKFPVTDNEIRVFFMSELPSALLKKMNEKNLVDISTGVPGTCLQLFLDLLPSELGNRARFVRLPEVKRGRNRRIVGFIRENYMNRVRLEHLTRVVPLSVRQISRCFQEEVHISVMEYLKIYRLLRASLYLYETNRKVIDIAQECGFQAVSSFYDEFRHHFGMSPHQFRKHISR